MASKPRRRRSAFVGKGRAGLQDAEEGPEEELGEETSTFFSDNYPKSLSKKERDSLKPS